MVDNWLAEIVQDASRKVDSRPQSRKSVYWEERRRQIKEAIDERCKDATQKESGPAQV